MRPLSAAARIAMTAQETGEVLLYLLALSHPTMVTPMYFVNNTEAIVSGGISYQAYPFDVMIPDDTEEISTIKLTIDNIDRRIVEAIRRIDAPAKFTLSMIMASEPDTLLVPPIPCTLQNVSYTAQVVTGDIAPYEDIINAIFPLHNFDPARFPGVFA